MAFKSYSLESPSAGVWAWKNRRGDSYFVTDFSTIWSTWCRVLSIHSRVLYRFARLIVMRPQFRRWPQKGMDLLFQFGSGWTSQLSISAPPGACPRHLILKRGDLWRTARNQRKFEARRNRRQSTSRKAAPIRTARARSCKCPSGLISGHETGGKNIAQVPNTVGGNLNPSVAHEFQGRAVTSKNTPDKRARTPRPVTEIKRKDA